MPFLWNRGGLILAFLSLVVLPPFAGTGVGAAPYRALGDEATPAGFAAGRVFSTSFESIEDFAGFYIAPQNQFGTASHEQSTAQVRSGTYAHRGWIYGANPPSSPEADTNHRGYPTVQLYKTEGGGYVCPCDVKLWVWLDMPLDDPGEWYSFATLSADPTDAWAPVVLVNVSAPNPAPGTAPGGIVHLMHVPSHGERNPTFQTSAIQFPQRQWVELKIRVDFDPDNGYAQVWQDGQLVSAAEVNGGNGKLEQAHFGLYSAPGVGSGVVYNDDLEIREAPASVGGAAESPHLSALPAPPSTQDGLDPSWIALAAGVVLLISASAVGIWRRGLTRSSGRT